MSEAITRIDNWFNQSILSSQGNIINDFEDKITRDFTVQYSICFLTHPVHKGNTHLTRRNSIIASCHL